MALSRSMNGLLIKGVGGLYTVDLGDSLMECRACGRFRRERITPLAGDLVKVERQEDGTAKIVEVKIDRKYVDGEPVADEELIIQAELNGLAVTVIGKGAFSLLVTAEADSASSKALKAAKLGDQVMTLSEWLTALTLQTLVLLTSSKLHPVSLWKKKLTTSAKPLRLRNVRSSLSSAARKSPTKSASSAT